ncbi:MAG: GNAT family N-acetyltransferase [Thaumarchaeota archaeon]|nr:GNAT family N-acetyltransferase [Nitrososphaerota archaeon]
MVRFIEVSEADFQRWAAASVDEYVSERVKAGNDEKNSPERSRDEFRSLLPRGRLTKNNYVYSIVDENDAGRVVGIIWYAVDHPDFAKNTLYIYDIRIEEHLRGKGYGRAALLLLEERARALGKRRIALHVFAHNERARRLYEELGYKPTNIVMAKELGQALGDQIT